MLIASLAWAIQVRVNHYYFFIVYSLKPLDKEGSTQIPMTSVEIGSDQVWVYGMTMFGYIGGENHSVYLLVGCRPPPGCKIYGRVFT